MAAQEPFRKNMSVAVVWIGPKNRAGLTTQSVKADRAAQTAAYDEAYEEQLTSTTWREVDGSGNWRSCWSITVKLHWTVWQLEERYGDSCWRWF